MAGDAPSPGPGSLGAGSPDQADRTRSGPSAAPLALYRRYRPASFAEVKGQDHVTEPLRQALRSGRVHHAYLFSGPRGCGKTSSARILARSLNCEQGPTPDPCGVCASCVALAPAGPGSIDVIEIDAASHGGVDDARDLRERAFYSPVAGRYKIYIIDEAHMVTREGFNALLKLVEEPPPHLKFVFATTEPEKVIATIRSRTHHYPFRLVPPAVLREHLEQILASEGVPYEPAVLPIVIRAGGGSVRDAMSVLDQLVAGSDESGLRHDRAIALLGYTDDRLLDEVVDAFAADDGAAVFHAIDHVVEAGHDPRRFAADLLDRLRDLIVISAVPDAAASGLIDASPDRVEELGKQAAAFGRAGLTRAAEIISAGLVEMRGATSPRLLLELMCAQVLLPAAGADTAGMVERLDRLERRLSASGQQATAPAPSAAAPRPRATPPAGAPAPDAPAAGSPAADGPPASAGSASAGSSSAGSSSAGSSSAGSSSAGSSRTGSSRTGSSSTGSPRTSAPGSGQPTAAASAQPAPGLAPATAAAPPAASPATPAPSAGTSEVPADTHALRVRWPDVLAAVQSHGKRVAWMQLSNASVESFADGVLTLAFAQAGIAKGFVTGGYDKDLSQVLSDLFGVTPTIRTSVGISGSADSGPGPTYSPPRPAERSAAPRPADEEPGPSGDAGTPGPAAQAAETGRSGGDRPQQQAKARGTSARPESSRTVSSRAVSSRTVSSRTVSSRTVSSRTESAGTASARAVAADTVSARTGDNEPAPGDRPAPDVLTGTDLIERELGGRIIQELDGP
jgi:DNA polymerase III subunit gamma/tau